MGGRTNIVGILMYVCSYHSTSLQAVLMFFGNALRGVETTASILYLFIFLVCVFLKVA